MRKETNRYNHEMSHMLELSDEDFKETIMKFLREIMNYLETLKTRKS